MAEYEWAQITLGKNAEIQKIATAAAKASDLLTANVQFAKAGLQLAQVFLQGIINPKVILLNAIADEIDNFTNDLRNTGFFILEVVPTGMEMIPENSDGNAITLRVTKKQVEEGWASAKSESLEVQTAWKTWAKEKLGETNWNGIATKEFYDVVQGRIETDEDSDVGAGSNTATKIHPIFGLPMMTPSQVIGQIIAAMDDELDNKRPQFSPSAEVGAVIIIIGFSDITKTLSSLKDAMDKLIAFFGGKDGIFTKGFQKTAQLIEAPLKVFNDGPDLDNAITVTVANVSGVRGSDENIDFLDSPADYNYAKQFEKNDFIIGPRSNFGTRVLGYVSEVVSTTIDENLPTYATQVLKIIGASRLDDIAWEVLGNGAQIQKAHFFVNQRTSTNQNTGEVTKSSEFNDFKYFEDLEETEEGPGNTIKMVKARTKVELKAGEPLLQPIGEPEDILEDMGSIKVRSTVIGTIVEPKKKKAPPPNFKSAKLEDLIGDFGGFFSSIDAFSNTLRQMAGDSSTALNEVVEFLDKKIEKLSELNDILQTILRIFGDGLPSTGVYSLSIPPVIGGNDAIKKALSEATERPPDSLDMSVGYVMIGGGPSMKVLNTLISGG